MGGLHRGEEAERRKRPVSHAFFSQPGGILSDNHFSPGTVTSHSQLQSRTPENDWFLEPVGGLAKGVGYSLRISHFSPEKQSQTPSPGNLFWLVRPAAD